MQYLSEGWPSKHDLGTDTRRVSGRYRERQLRYTQTSQRLGDIRSALIGLAIESNVQPPLTREDIRLGKRQEEISLKLGTVGLELLTEHAGAVDANCQAMLELRDEANRLNAKTHHIAYRRLPHDHHADWRTIAPELHHLRGQGIGG